MDSNPAFRSNDLPTELLPRLVSAVVAVGVVAVAVGVVGVVAVGAGVMATDSCSGWGYCC